MSKIPSKEEADEILAYRPEPWEKWLMNDDELREWWANVGQEFYGLYRQVVANAGEDYRFTAPWVALHLLTERYVSLFLGGPGLLESARRHVKREVTP